MQHTTLQITFQPKKEINKLTKTYTTKINFILNNKMRKREDEMGIMKSEKKEKKNEKKEKGKNEDEDEKTKLNNRITD